MHIDNYFKNVPALWASFLKQPLPRANARGYSLTALRAWIPDSQAGEDYLLTRPAYPFRPVCNGMRIRPEGPAVNRPGRQAGIANNLRMSAEGAAPDPRVEIVVYKDQMCVRSRESCRTKEAVP